MGIIIKFVLKNIKEKKFRTFLILFSIMLSAALYFASSAISGTVAEMYTQRIRTYYGNADIVIHAGEKSPGRFVTAARAAEFGGRMEYIIGAVEGSGTYKYQNESVNLNLKGFTLDELQLNNPILLDNEDQAMDLRALEPFIGKKVIISKNLAQKYQLNPGDHLDVEIQGAKHRFIIAGLAQPAGIFQDDGRSNVLLMPRNTLGAIYAARGKSTIIYLKLKNPAELQQTLTDLSRSYRRYVVREPFSKAELLQNTSMITTPFMLMVSLVLLMSIFIIYTACKVIMRERLPVIGTFRSIGATRRTTNTILFAESLLYGIIGGITGCILGIGILYAMTLLISGRMTGIPINISFNIGQMIAAFLLAIVLAAVSSAVPIIKTSKIPVKDIVLNKLEKAHKKKLSRVPLGVVMLVATIIVPYYTPRTLALPIDMLCMIGAILAVIMLIPYFTGGFIKLFERIYGLFGNEGVLAVKNLRGNRSILNNISLLAIGISSLLMINTVSFSVERLVVNAYRDFKFDIWMGIWPADRRMESILRTVDGVKDVYGFYGANSVELADRPERIYWINGVNPAKFADYMEVNLIGNSRDLLAELDQDRNILISSTLREKYGVKKGDWLTLKMKRGNKSYKIIGFFNSVMENGSYALIAERYLKTDMMLRDYSEIFVKTAGDPGVVAQAIQKKFQRQRPWLMTIPDMEKRNMQSSYNMFLILRGFSVLAMLIGIIGVLNNLLISFLERQRSLAVMRSVGMSKRQEIKMILIESLTCGLIGGVIGVLGGILLIQVVPQLCQAIDLPLSITYAPSLFVYSLIGGIIITVSATMSPAFKSARANIIEAIKYE